MKKLVLGLFLFLSCFSFADWQIMNTLDEFQDQMDKKCIVSIDYSNIGLCRIEKTLEEDGEYVVILVTNQYIGSHFTTVKFKIDDLEPISFKGAIIQNNIVGFKVNKNHTNLFDLLSNGKTLKVSIQKYNGSTILQKHSLDGFAKTFAEYY